MGLLKAALGESTAGATGNGADPTEQWFVCVLTLYLQAEQDRLVRKSSFQEIQELKPDTVLGSIAAPHFVLQREPRKAADLIAHFVAGLPI